MRAPFHLSDRRMPTVDLGTLCELMYNEGLDFASFTDGVRIDTLPGIGCKPRASVFFSELAPTADGDTDQTMIRPEWYTWIMHEEFHTLEYSTYDIAFATIDSSTLIAQTHPGFLPRGDYTSGSATVNWNMVCADGWSGVHVHTPRAGMLWQLAGWDVPTVAVWESKALTELMLFRNAGEPWTYFAEPGCA